MKVVIVGYGRMFQSLISGVLESEHQIVGVFRHEYVLFPFFERLFKDFILPSKDFNFIKAHGLHEIKAKSVNSKKFINEIKSLQADIILTGSWSEKFSIQTINSPKIACINVHPSLLPKYRGPNPYIHVILDGQDVSGITFHLMDVNYDTGAILHQAKVNVLENESGKSLKLKCCNLAQKEVGVFLANFQEKFENQISQNEYDSTYQSQVSLAEAILDFEKETSCQIDTRIRALTPWMKCYICYNREFFTFKDYKIYSKLSQKPPASIIKKTKNSLFIVCKDKKVIEFSSLEIQRPVLKLFTKFYLKNFVKINTKAL